VAHPFFQNAFEGAQSSLQVGGFHRAQRDGGQVADAPGLGQDIGVRPRHSVHLLFDQAQDVAGGLKTKSGGQLGSTGGLTFAVSSQLLLLAMVGSSRLGVLIWRRVCLSLHALDDLLAPVASGEEREGREQTAPPNGGIRIAGADA